VRRSDLKTPLLIGGGEGAAGGDAVSTFVLLSSTGRGGEGAGGDAVSTSVLLSSTGTGGEGAGGDAVSTSVLSSTAAIGGNQQRARLFTCNCFAFIDFRDEA